MDVIENYECANQSCKILYNNSEGSLANQLRVYMVYEEQDKARVRVWRSALRFRKNTTTLGLGFGDLPKVKEEHINARVRVWRSA